MDHGFIVKVISLLRPNDNPLGRRSTAAIILLSNAWSQYLINLVPFFLHIWLIVGYQLWLESGSTWDFILYSFMPFLIQVIFIELALFKESFFNWEGEKWFFGYDGNVSIQPFSWSRWLSCDKHLILLSHHITFSLQLSLLLIVKRSYKSRSWPGSATVPLVYLRQSFRSDHP